MFEKHPLIAWLSVVGTVVTLAAGVAGAWYFILDERERSIEQTDLLLKVRDDQVEIRKELALQTDGHKNIERSLDKLEDGQDRIVREINTGLLGMAVNVGRLLERSH